MAQPRTPLMLNCDLIRLQPAGAGLRLFDLLLAASDRSAAAAMKSKKAWNAGAGQTPVSGERKQATQFARLWRCARFNAASEKTLTTRSHHYSWDDSKRAGAESCSMAHSLALRYISFLILCFSLEHHVHGSPVNMPLQRERGSHLPGLGFLSLT
jgi:hypothetical protein